MKKLKLDLSDLTVDTFETTVGALKSTAGTVFGQSILPDDTNNNTCDNGPGSMASCNAEQGVTCGGCAETELTDGSCGEYTCAMACTNTCNQTLTECNATGYFQCTEQSCWTAGPQWGC